MKLTFIITIDPVKGVDLLNVLLHSLNLQTHKAFDVVFYNQTLMDKRKILSKLLVAPKFNYRFLGIHKKFFLGKYPLWDIYAFHRFLLDQNILNDYSMSLHMEEFLDTDYVENAIKVLGKNKMDILFGNLGRTRMTYEEIKPILETKTAEEFGGYLRKSGIKHTPHWAWGKELVPTRKGYTNFKKRYEDVHFMSTRFARRYNWFLKGRRLPFEDIHISDRKGIFELSKKLERITVFPLHFNLSKIYHVSHKKYYYQLECQDFTRRMLRYKTGDPVLNSLKIAIQMYQKGKWDLNRALAHTRRNPLGTGTQNLNCQYHLQYLNGKK